MYISFSLWNMKHMRNTNRHCEIILLRFYLSFSIDSSFFLCDCFNAFDTILHRN